MMDNDCYLYAMLQSTQKAWQGLNTPMRPGHFLTQLLFCPPVMILFLGSLRLSSPLHVQKIHQEYSLHKTLPS
jgi:hypothetical protein